MILTFVIQSAGMMTPIAAPPAPPAPPALPIVNLAPARMTDAGGQSIAPQLSEIDVVIRDAARTLWQGTLRVADRGMTTNWSEMRNEPPRELCPLRPLGWTGEGEALSLSLGASGRDVPDSLAVQVKWTRRGAAACDGVRTVELRQTVIARSGKPVTITADGGLRVELRRR